MSPRMGTARSRLRGVNPLGVGVLALTVAAVGFGAWMVVPVVNLYKEPPKAPPTASVLEQDRGRFKAAMDRNVAMVDGRSLFAIPDPPAEKPPERARAATYGGPSLIAYMNSTAWFSDGTKLSPSSPTSKSLRLVRANPPWSVRVEWEGGEFDVELFKKIPLGTLSTDIKPSQLLTPATPAAATQPATAPGAPTATGQPNQPDQPAPAGTPAGGSPGAPSATGPANGPVPPGPGADPPPASQPQTTPPAGGQAPVEPPPAPAEPNANSRTREATPRRTAVSLSIHPEIPEFLQS